MTLSYVLAPLSSNDLDTHGCEEALTEFIEVKE